MRGSGIILSLLVAVQGSATFAAVVSGPVIDPANNHTYYLLSQNNWTGAEAEAVSLGGTLATVRNSSENAFITTAFGNNRNLWIGLYDPTQDSLTGPAHDANMVWVSGETNNYRNWSVGEPNNTDAFGHSEWYTMIWGNAANIAASPSTRILNAWNDVELSSPQIDTPYGVVEVVPEPGTFGLMGVAGLSALLRRRH